MSAARFAIAMAFAAALLCAGCAVSPEDESRRQAKEADIAAILGIELDPVEYGEPKRCLADSEIRTFRALDSRRILFQGRHGKLWINTLRMACPDLRWGDILVVRSFSGLRLCDMDTFRVADWFHWPWYRRWPWHWGGSWGSGAQCSLGKFQPVTPGQLAEIEAIIKTR